MEREGSQCLQALTPKISCTETVQRAHKEFEDFFLQAAVCAQRSRWEGWPCEVGKCRRTSGSREETGWVPKGST
jgi:hypothetical protein